MQEPIRVLNLFTIMNRGGAETMVMNYYRHMDRSRVQFDFLVHREERGAYEDEIEALGGRIYRMPPVRPWTAHSYRKAIRHFFAEHPEYRILHAHMSELGLYAFQVAKQMDIPVRICHAHNCPHGIDLKSPVRWYMKTLMRPYITHHFMCGQESGEWLFGKKYANEFVQMNNAIDSTAFVYDPARRREVRQALSLPEDVSVVGHVGRFNKQKNHPFLIDVFSAYLDLEPNAVLLLVGNGSGMQTIQRKAEKLGIADKVCFLGSRGDVPDLMQAMDVFVFPSLFEGLGIALVEAEASGLPCVVSNVIPPESYVTDLVFPLKLTDAPMKWAEVIQNKMNRCRADTSQQIAAHGFDIRSEACKLQQFYLEAYEQNK